ncbi:hypothetical protein Hanom_Chr04g00352091 [Helianthus anomalus]
MSSSSNSSWSVNRTPKLFKVDLNGNLYYHHEILFDCKFFMWKQDFDKFFEAHSNCTSSLISYKELKNENLQLQNKLLLEENKMLKRQIRGKKSMWKQPFVFTMFFVIYMDVHFE